MSLDASLARLSARRLLPVCLGDQNVAESKCGSIEADFTAWKTSLLEQLFGVFSDRDLQGNSVLPATAGSTKQVICSLVGRYNSTCGVPPSGMLNCFSNCWGH